MKILRWYSVIWITLSLLFLIIGLISGTQMNVYERAIDLWAIAFAIPVAVYLWVLIKRKGKE